MNITTRWHPIRDLENLSDRLDQIFGRNAPARQGEAGRDATFTIPEWTPSVDITETPQEFAIKVELPGVNKEDVKINLSEGILRIEGERKQEKEEKDKKHHRIERSYGSFMRSFTVPDNIDEAKINAKYEDGLLIISLPKAEKPQQNVTEIPIL